MAYTDNAMTDLPQWAVERARELAALWNDPGQGEAIARALAEAAKPKWRTDMDAVPQGRKVLLFNPAENRVGEGVRSDRDDWDSDDDNAMIETWWWANDSCSCCHEPMETKPTRWMPLPPAPEVG